MKFYIATTLDNWCVHNLVRDILSKQGHEITYDWTIHGPAWPKGLDFVREIALNECSGVLHADFVVVLLPAGRGTHVELGMAIALRKPIVIYSQDPTIFTACKETCTFYHLPNVLHASHNIENIPVIVKTIEGYIRGRQYFGV